MNNIDYKLRIGIFFESPKWAYEKATEIVSNIKEEGKISVHVHLNINGCCEITNNYLYIKFVSANENCCNQRFNRIYYQEEIDEEVLKRRVYPTFYNPNPLPLQ